MDDFKKDRKDYSDFFHTKPDGAQPDNQEQRDNREENAGAQPKQSYYYSYGPFKSMNTDQVPEADVEISRPAPVRPYRISDGDHPQIRGWEYDRPKKKSGSSFRSMFAAFMAGVLVVGGLMFASDKMNLFSGGDAGVLGATAGVSAPSKSADGNNNGADVKGASFPIVRPDNISSIVKQASPAVVKVENFQTVRSQSNPFFDDPFFRQFFGDNGDGMNQQKQKQSEPQMVGFGSGFFFDKSGLILTNDHVIEGAEQVKIEVMGRKDPLVAKVLGKSYDLDLAVLKVEGDNFPYLNLDDSNNLNVGDWLVAIGNPYGFDHTVTVGVLSATEREIPVQDENGTRQYKHLLQTDASINPGNSGGPLLDLNGNVIGINTAVSAEAQGIGFAIPTSTISEVLDQLKNSKNVETPKPYIGVELRDIQPQWTKMLKINSTDGALISGVSFDTPAYKAGLQTYDIIVKVNGDKVKSSDEVVKKVEAMKPGEIATFSIIRNGQQREVKVTIGDKNDAANQDQVP